LRRTYDQLRAAAKREGVDLSMYEDVLQFKSRGSSAVDSTPKVVNAGEDQEVSSSVAACPQDVCVEKTVARVSHPPSKFANR
jgi:hypothetical protein